MPRLFFLLLLTACDPVPDADADGIPDAADNCPRDANADQLDSDGDGVGDACATCAEDCDDADCDRHCDTTDNCAPPLSNPLQTDSDGDGMGDPCDTCPYDIGDRFDGDPDGDAVCTSEGLNGGPGFDNCPEDHNPYQTDSDGDGLGDICDPTP